MYSQSGAMNLGSLIHVAPIASGGMGRVELAAKEDGGFRRLYAVKRLHPHCAADPDLCAMFMDEARIAGLMHHNNVVAVVDVGEDSAGPYLVMDYVDGLAVDRLLKCVSQQKLHMPLQVALRIAHEVARGLHAAHELCDHDGNPLHVIHRDVTPHNILVGYDGSVRITDFGVAKSAGREARTTTGVLKGKVAYMSPEQLRFEDLTPRSDLFSLGVVLFEMLSTRRLYKMSRPRASIRRILDEPPPDIAEHRPEAPPELVSLLFDLLGKDPDQRPASAEAVGDELQAILSNLVADEGTISVRSFIEPVTADQRKAQQEHLNQSISHASALRKRNEDATEVAPAPEFDADEGPGDNTREEASAGAISGGEETGGERTRKGWLKWAVLGLLVAVVMGTWFRMSREEALVPATADASRDEGNTPQTSEARDVRQDPAVQAVEIPVEEELPIVGPATVSPVGMTMRRRRGMRPETETPQHETVSMDQWEEW